MSLSCGLLLAAVVAAAWPIWRYQHEYGMFARRAILAGVTVEGSRVRRWLWAGRIARLAEVFSALAWSAVLVAFAHLLTPLQWGALAADAVLLAAASRWVERRMASEVRGESLGLAARRWPLAWGNMALLAIAFLAIDFFAGAPDTRGQAWEAVARNAYAAGAAASACPAAQWAVGAIAAADALAWHAAEILIPSLPGSGWRLAAWLVFLLQAGIVAIAWTRLLLGVAALADRRTLVSSRPYFAMAAALVALLAALALAPGDLEKRLRDVASEVVIVANPCRAEPRPARSLRTDLAVELQAARAHERQLASQRVESAVDGLYAGVERGVDDYLDWYFTVVGEYQRLAALAAGNFAGKMEEEMRSRIFGEDFGRRLDEASARLATESRARLADVAARFGARVRREAAQHPCWTGDLHMPAVGDLERDVLRAGTAGAAGTTVGIVTAALLARQAASAVAKRASSRRVFQGAAALAGRAVAKRGGSALGAAVGAGAACGPFAPLCALVAGGVTWITLDKAFIEVDKLRLRDEMRAELLAAAAEQKTVLSKALAEQHHRAIDEAAGQIDASLGRVFVPAGDVYRPVTAVPVPGPGTRG